MYATFNTRSICCLLQVSYNEEIRDSVVIFS
jgi:hypothetical protein